MTILLLDSIEQFERKSQAASALSVSAGGAKIEIFEGDLGSSVPSQSYQPTHPPSRFDYLDIHR